MSNMPANKRIVNFEFCLKVYEVLLEQRFGVKDSDFSSRDINEFNKNGLLWENYTNPKWRKFNFVEFIWLKILHELTLFGVKKKIISSLREELLKPIIFGEYKQMLPIDYLNILYEESGLSVEEWEEFKAGYSTIPDNEVMEGFTILLLLLVGVIYEKQNVLILIDKIGNILPYSENKMQELMKIPDFIEFYTDMTSNDHFSLNITNKVKDFAKTNFDIDLPTKLNIITEDEQEVLKLIRSKKLKSLKINFNENEISLIEATEEVSPNPESRFIDCIIKGGYQSVTFTTVKGKIVKFENTIKIKPDKKV